MSAPVAVLAILHDWTACSTVRVAAPMAALQRQGYPARWLRDGDPRIPAVAAQSDAVILPRAWWAPADQAHGQALLDELHGRGHAVIAEYDDDVVSDACLDQLALIDPAQSARATLVAELAARRWAVARCDGVTVPTAALAAVVRQYTAAPIEIVPNAVDWPVFRRQYQAAPRTVDGLTIGWAGGQRADAEFTALAAAWAQVAAACPAVQFVVAGYAASPLLAAVPAGRLTVEPWRSLRQAAAAYRNIDILCCPLTETPFGICKSPLKAFEGGAAGCVVVASRCVYNAVLRHGRDGLIVDTVAEWAAALVGLARDATTRRILAQRWSKRVRERHSLAGTVGAWPDAWARLMGAARGQRGAA